MLYSILEAIAPAFLAFVVFLAFFAVCVVLVLAANGAGLDPFFTSLFSKE